MPSIYNKKWYRNVKKIGPPINTCRRDVSMFNKLRNDQDNSTSPRQHRLSAHEDHTQVTEIRAYDLPAAVTSTKPKPFQEKTYHI